MERCVRRLRRVERRRLGSGVFVVSRLYMMLQENGFLLPALTEKGNSKS